MTTRTQVRAFKRSPSALRLTSCHPAIFGIGRDPASSAEFRPAPQSNHMKNEKEGSTMPKVVWHVTMSLDGFIAGPDDAMEWVFEYPGPTRLASEVIATTGAVLAGRRSYEMGRKDAGKGSGEVYGGAWTGPQFVLTHNPPDDEANPAITFMSGDIERAVTTALESAEGDNVVVIGADVARQCLDRGVLDEIVVHVAPVLLGDGIRLFQGPGAPRIQLKRTRAATSGELTDLRFAVAK